MSAFGHLLLTEAIPTVVELEQDQYSAFLQMISDISIDIDSENLTINADLKELTNLQRDTVQEIRAQREILDSDLQEVELALSIQTSAVGRALNDLSDRNAEGFLMINTTLTELRKLEMEEVQAITNEFFSQLDNINRVLGTINSAADTISTVIGVINTFLSSTQSGLLTEQVTQQTQTNTLLQEFVTVFPTKVRTSVAEATWELNTGNLDGTGLAFDICTITDPVLGVGPIFCEGLETTDLIQNGVSMVPVVIPPENRGKAADTTSYTPLPKESNKPEL